jgi:hypothetical protein
MPLQDCEQQGRERDEREKRLPETGVNADKRVVGEAERAAEDERAIEQHAQQRAVAREREPHDGHDGSEKASREQEAQPGAPQRIELTVADPHADGVSAREHSPDDERRERRAVPVELHERTLRAQRAGRPASLPSAGRRDFSRRYVPNPSSGGGGNRTRVRGRTARASTSLGCR